MKKTLILSIVALAVLCTVFSGTAVQAFDHVFGVQVEGDVVRSRGRFRTNRHGVTRFRTRGITRQDSGSDYGACAGNDAGGCSGAFGVRAWRW